MIICHLAINYEHTLTSIRLCCLQNVLYLIKCLTCLSSDNLYWNQCQGSPNECGQSLSWTGPGHKVTTFMFFTCGQDPKNFAWNMNEWDVLTYCRHCNDGIWKRKKTVKSQNDFLSYTCNLKIWVCMWSYPVVRTNREMCKYWVQEDWCVLLSISSGKLSSALARSVTDSWGTAPFIIVSAVQFHKATLPPCGQTVELLSSDWSSHGSHVSLSTYGIHYYKFKSEIKNSADKT